MRARTALFVLISVALHLPLIALVTERPVPVSVAPLAIRFEKPKTEPPKPREEPRRIPPKRPPPEPVQMKQVQPPIEPRSPAPPETEPTPQSIPVDPTRTLPPEQTVNPAVGPREASLPAPALAPPRDAPPIDVDAIRRGYFQEIVRQIEANKRYPRIAVQRNWEGKVGLSFAVTADGSIESVKVVTRSDYALLDSAAVDAVTRASPLPRPPAELTTPLTLRIDITFTLTD
jgi:protein TonB